MVEKQKILRPCIGCRKMSPLGIPITLCKECSKIVENYMNVKEGMSRIFRESRGIEQIEFKGKGDLALSFNIICERIAKIQEECAWIWNNLHNMKMELEKSVT